MEIKTVPDSCAFLSHFFCKLQLDLKDQLLWLKIDSK